MTVDALAASCVSKIRYAVAGAPPALQDYLETFYDQIDPLILTHLRQAQKSERETAIRELQRAGFVEAAASLGGP